MRYTRALPALFITASLVVSGCAAEKNVNAAEAPRFNTADVKFARGMIPHHSQAIQMARLADSRASDPAVEQLAQKIEVAQAPEIRMMQGWLRAWNKSLQPGKSGARPMGHGGSMKGMSGMMPMSDMQHLRSVKGPAFDAAFLGMMIEHHKRAIDMAHVEERRGINPRAVALAKKIQQAQAAEIQKMTGMLPD